LTIITGVLLPGQHNVKTSSLVAVMPGRTTRPIARWDAHSNGPGCAAPAAGRQLLGGRGTLAKSKSKAVRSAFASDE
jgi:hypothetical protein